MSFVEEFEDTFSTKEEFEDDGYIDNKVIVSEVAITACDDHLKECIKNDSLQQFELPTLDIKTETLPKVCTSTINETVTPEAADIKIEIITDNGFLFCEHCHVYYEDYCTTCGMLVHILNSSILNNADKKAKEQIPQNILEIGDSIERLGIFALKDIPEGVKFGPFIGLDNSQCPWRIKGGRFVVSADKTKSLNWMQYINPARSTLEQNLLVFQCQHNLYYQSTRQIRNGEELLVYFGEEDDDSLKKIIEIDFIPTVKNDDKDIFACTFCCLGFSSREYLSKHKTICRNTTYEQFSVQELVQCLSCKIYLDENEYSKNHMAFCCERNVRKCIPPANQTAEANERKTRPRRHIYKCEQCKYRTKYKAELKNHTNRHYKQFKTQQSLGVHLENVHSDVVVKDDPEHSTSDYMQAHIKAAYSFSQDEMKQFKCSLCTFRTKYKLCLKRHVNARHLKECNYKCDISDFKTNLKARKEINYYTCGTCDFKSNQKSNLEKHISTIHLNELNYGCDICDYKTNYKQVLEKHVKTKHLKEFDYKCDICDFKTNQKADLERHIKIKHLKEFDYKCETCEFETSRKYRLECHVKTKHLNECNYRCDVCDFKSNCKSNLEAHIKTVHLKEFNYNCGICQYKTNGKSNLDTHIKTKHLKEFTYRCDICQYKTNGKTNLDFHVKTKHLKEFNYKCDVCKYKTNYKQVLEKHIKTKHLKEFNYMCDVCDYKTNYTSNLEKHIKTKHLKEFSYKCDVCDYKTNGKADLKSHIRRKHHEDLSNV